MDDITLALQKGIYDRLRADVALNALFGTIPRVYDRVPPALGLIFPYIRIGEDSEIIDDLDCADFHEITAIVHVFSRQIGKVDLKNIAGAVRTCLKAGFPVTPYDMMDARFLRTRFLTDPDGLTEHAHLEFTFDLTTP
jgi:hypothetical protein